MNTLNCTNTELAKKIGCSRQVVVDTMKILTDAGLVVRKGTVIRLSARVFVKGDAQKEAYIMRKFTEEKEVLNGQESFTDPIDFAEYSDSYEQRKA
jgi:DNA-binding Lrp family transcriptional regulator